MDTAARLHVDCWSKIVVWLALQCWITKNKWFPCKILGAWSNLLTSLIHVTLCRHPWDCHYLRTLYLRSAVLISRYEGKLFWISFWIQRPAPYLLLAVEITNDLCDIIPVIMYDRNTFLLYKSGILRIKLLIHSNISLIEINGKILKYVHSLHDYQDKK